MTLPSPTANLRWILGPTLTHTITLAVACLLSDFLGAEDSLGSLLKAGNSAK